MASTLALRGVPAARRAEGPPSCGARASRATAGGVRASRRPRLAHAPWRSATPPPRASTRARALAVDRGEALGDDDDALAELVFEGTDTKSRRARVSAGDERDVAETDVAVASEDFEYLHKTLAASLSFDTQHPERQKAPTNEPAPSSNDDDTYDKPPKARVLQNASLGEYCTLGVGGAARAVVEAYTIDQLIATLKVCASNGVESVVIGKGSNVLFSASGFDGVVIVNRVEFVQELDAVCDDDDDDASSGAKKTMTKTKKTRLFRVGSGTPFNALGASLSKKNWSGLEFAVGVPGTAGGAAFMNAGADGQDTAGVLESVELVSPCGGFRRTAKIVSSRETKVGDDSEDAKNASEIDTSRTSSSAEESETLFVSSDAFGYRRSPFMERGGERADDGSSGLAGWIVTAVTFRLTRDSLAASRAREFMRRRRSTQPLAERSVGCLFRNPGAGLASAGAAIDRAGLKNFTIGAARVSSTHANFLVVDERNKFFSGGVSSSGAIDSRLPSTDSRDSFRAKKLSAKRGSRDMEALIAAVKARVLRDSGVVLEEEVRRVPFRFRADPTPKREKERKEKKPGADEKKNDDDGVDAEGSVRLEPGPR
jgi:UDP-N-acetylenolpyruvoylglucosamine reductase